MRLKKCILVCQILTICLRKPNAWTLLHIFTHPPNRMQNSAQFGPETRLQGRKSVRLKSEKADILCQKEKKSIEYCKYCIHKSRS